MTAEKISIEQACRICGHRSGLVLGQSLSTRLTIQQIQRDLMGLAIDQCPDASLRAALDGLGYTESLDTFAGAHPAEFEHFRAAAVLYLRQLQDPPQLESIVGANWSAAVSLCLDANLENRFREFLSGRPLQRNVVVVASQMNMGRPATLLPVYKLLGSTTETSERARVAVTQSERLLRNSGGPRLLRGLPDFLREGGLVFFGIADQLPDVREFLASLYAGLPPYPNFLIFHEADLTGGDPVILRLAKERSFVYVIGESPKQFSQALQSPSGSQFSLALNHTSALNSGSHAREFHQYRSYVDVVPNQQPAYQLSQKRMEVWDSLFRPNSSRWDAFLFDLDLPRDATPKLEAQLKALTAIPELRPKIFHLSGEAGVGKTVVAKRVAINLARAGHLAVWCKKSTGQSLQWYREFSKALKQRHDKRPESHLYLFWDDPWAVGLVPVEFTAALANERLNVVVVIVSRNSDKAVTRGGSRLPNLDDQSEVDYQLSPTEEGGLPAFLVKAGAASDLIEAQRMLLRNSGSNARDILCRLWYLLPDTREQFQESVSDEYFRLESVDQFIDNIAGSAEVHGSIARRAYEAVAVTSGLGFGIPTEVLVSALQVNYNSWLQMCQGGRPLWGLLYPVEDEQGEDYWYLTRNEVVTEILLRILNGGVGHAGEARTLRLLVESCTGSTLPYRDFLVELLVKSKDRLRKILTPAEGRQLYELAISTFPIQDRTLVHHYAKWVTDVQHDHKEAYAILERALDTPDYPYAQQEERREFVHTSMAAVILQRVQKGEQDRASGLIGVKRHLAEASSPTFFNLYTVHVQVNALLRLQQGDDAVSLDSYVEACRALERAQQLAGSHGRRQMRNQDALAMLEDQKRQLSSKLAPFAELRVAALERFESTGDQLVLEAAALRGLIEASIADKGSAYNEVLQFLSHAQDRVIRKKQRLNFGLRQARVDLIVRWRLQHENGDVDWNAFLGDVREIRDEPSRRDDILLLFYEAVACFHLRFATDAQAAFSRLRGLQIPGILVGYARLYLRAKGGRPERAQGILKKGTTHHRVQLSDFDYDAPIYRDRLPPGAQDGAVVHCWVSFSLQGPLAEFNEPNRDDVLLPN